MTRKISSLLILSLLMFAFLAMTATAAKSPVQRRVIDERVIKMSEYAFPDEHNFTRGESTAKESGFGQALGSFSPTASPGMEMGDTWYDYQHNGAMGRMIESKTTGGQGTIVHMGWMYLPGPTLASREYNYNGYDITNEGFGSRTGLQPDDDYAGYVGIAVTGDNRGIIGGHNNEPADALYDPHFYWDYSTLASYFGANDQLPRALASIGSPGNPDQEAIWPKFRWVEPAGDDPVMHVIAQESYPDPGDPQGINYYRRTGGDGAAGVWDVPACFAIDTIHDLSHDVAATDGGRVALVWTANLPCVAGGPSSAGDDCTPPRYNQWDNDVWYMISETHGSVGSWSSKINVTQYAVNELEADGYRPYTDLNVLMDSDDGELHIVWGASFWPTTAYSEGDAAYYQGRIFHWSENQAYERVVHAFDWFSPHCSPGAWNLNANKMSISQCRGKHYVLFAQMNDVPNGIGDTDTNGDCADEGNPGYPRGSANGELYVTISADGGLTWDEARNVTNSRTPGCDSATGIGGRCESDHWPSMSRYGVAEGNPSDTAQIMMYPGGDNTTGGSNYLDVLYINDPSAGGIVQNEGSWQSARVLWARLSCVNEVENALLGYVPTSIGWPRWTKNGRADTTDIKLENLGNAALTFTSINMIKDTEGASDWLDHTISSAPLPSGLGNVRDAEIYVNKAGVINDPGNVTLLKGRIEFVTNAPTSPDYFEISMVVADTVYPPSQDTISNSCFSVVVANNLEFGDADQDEISFGFPDDCDTTATNYLYSASPIIGLGDGETMTKMNWSIFSNTYADTIGFVQIGNPTTQVEVIGSHTYQTYDAKAYALDSSLIVESKFFAPQGMSIDTCGFVLQRLTIYDNPDDGEDWHYGLLVGEAFDWDVPSDSGSDNGTGFDEDLMAIWQEGAYYEDTTDGPCLPYENDTRVAGIDFLTMYQDSLGDIRQITDGEGRPFHNAYTADNATYVYGQDQGFDPDTLYALMTGNTGMSAYSSAVPESTYTDLHMVMTYHEGFDLCPWQKLVIWIEKWALRITSTPAIRKAIIDWSRQYFCEDFPIEDYVMEPNVCGCCVSRGNVDDVIGPAGPIDVSDLTYLVAYLFTGGDDPPCIPQGNVDSIIGPAGPIDVSDLTYLVAFLFTGGDAPPGYDIGTQSGC